MARFLIYRNGSNRANQELCERMAVAVVVASDDNEAQRIAKENIVFYANQTSEAVSEEDADGEDWQWVFEVGEDQGEHVFVRSC